MSRSLLSIAALGETDNDKRSNMLMQLQQIICFP